MAFIELSNTDEVYNSIMNSSCILLARPVQAGKSSDMLKIVEHTYKESATIFISDKNCSLQSQTNTRAKTCGWTIKNFRDLSKLGNPYKCCGLIKESCGKKHLFHTMMEVNNLTVLYAVICALDIPITLIIDEADKNKSVSEFDGDEESIPVVTRLLLKIKNELASKDNGSRVVFVTATPQSILVAEKDEKRLVVYKKPYNNYVGSGLNHTANLDVIVGVRDNNVKSTERWTNSSKDCNYNTYRTGINIGFDRFMDMESKDTSVKQLMLISLESRNRNQQKVAEYVRCLAKNDENVDVIVFNGESNDVSGVLSDAIKLSKKSKLIIVAGFMASRGVSFTDFSDPENKFELCLQVHYTKSGDPLNSACQAMRIFGPARRTITRPVIVCNRICAEDLMYNFTEAYRIVKDLAEGQKEIRCGSYNQSRPLTQAYNYRYMLQASYGGLVLVETPVLEHHSLIV